MKDPILASNNPPFVYENPTVISVDNAFPNYLIIPRKHGKNQFYLAQSKIHKNKIFI